MKTIIVTGANSGLGLWTSKYLLDLDYRVIMACRNLEKANKDIDAMPEFNKPKNYILMELDLADFESIRKFVDGLQGFKEIYGLDCNAGISYEGPFRYTKNGIEETFGTNYLGHFLLTHLLLKRFNVKRIVIIASELHNPNNKSPFAKANFGTVKEMSYPKMNPELKLERQTQSFYATSKLCDIMFCYELNRWLISNGRNETIVNAMNPGLMLATNLGRTHKFGENLYRKFLHGIFKLIGLGDTPSQSARSVVRLLHEITTSGNYYNKDTQVSSSEESYDLNKAKQLWEESELLFKENF